MDDWVTPLEWENGIQNIPKMKRNTQNYLRSKKRVKYTKSGRSVIYKREWIMDYYRANTSHVAPKAE